MPAQPGYAGRDFVGNSKDARRRYVRRVTLHRPDEELVILITDLVDEERYPAADLLAAYQHHRLLEAARTAPPTGRRW
jgi:hypothetical protein